MQTGESRLKTFANLEYKVLVSQGPINWFEALDMCRKEGGGAELLTFDPVFEQLRWIFQIIVSLTHSSRNRKQSDMPYASICIWHVNAHNYLYNRNSWAWANGRALEFLRQTTNPKNCTASGEIPYAVEFECFVLYYPHIEIVRPYLVDLNCTIDYTNRAICMRPINSIRTTKPETALIEFNSPKWVQSPRDDMLYYSFFDLQREFPFKSNWYSARCKLYGAELTTVEDYVEYEWLRGQIELNSKLSEERIVEGTYYFVDFHRFLYGIERCNWGKTSVPTIGLMGQELLPDRC